MAKKGRYNQVRGSESEKTAATDISLPSGTRKQALTRRKTGGKIELSDKPKKLTSVREKANYPPTANAVASKVSKPNRSNINSRRENSTPLQTKKNTVDNNNSEVRNGNSFKNNPLSFVALSISGFLVLFVLFFCIVPLKQISYEVPIVYQDIETYTEQEPYAETVYYSEKEPYTVTEAYTVSQPYMLTEPYVVYQPLRPPPPAPPHSAHAISSSTHAHSSSTHTTSAPPMSHSIPPGPHPIPPRPHPPQPVTQYREVISYMNVTKYRDVVQYKDVQKSRNETNFRPVQKQRTVTKVRQETRYRMVPLLYYVISY